MKDPKFLLRQYSDLQYEIKDLEKEINKMKDLQIEQDKVCGSSNVFPYTKKSFVIEGYNENDINRLIKRKKILRIRKNKCEELKLKIEEFINNIPDSKTRRVFKYRYIDNLNWQSIAMKLGKIHESYPRKEIHDKYLNNL